MPEPRPVPLDIPPGVVKTEAPRVTEGRYVDAQWVRFRGGKAEKRGGFSKQTTVTTLGVPRAAAAWRDLQQQDYIGVGTSKKLYVYDASFAQHDITPLDKQGTLATNPFTTTSGSKIVTVTHASHTRTPGSAVAFTGVTAFNGVALNGTFTVLVVLSASQYTVQAAAAASASGAGGGSSVTYSYEINIGAEAGTYALGYGTGGFGLSTFGTPRVASTLIIEPRIWSLQNYGALLFAAYNGGTIYQFDPVTLSTAGRALPLSNAPVDVRAMFITEERFVFALRDNMNVAWPDQNDPTQWTPTDANTANTRRLTDGTKLIAGLPLGQRLSLIWSDNALYEFQYTGDANIYSDRKVATNCGLIAPHAKAADSAGVVYWMSSYGFHLYSGAVRDIPRAGEIRDWVFRNLRADQPYLCWAYYDPKFSEVNFFYVPTGSDEPTLSVTYHINDQCWTPNDWGAFSRASATKFQHGDTRPYLGGVDGNIYLHEDGKNADGAAIAARLRAATMAVTDGAESIDIDAISMDLATQAGALSLQFFGYDRLRDGAIDSADVTLGETDEQIDLRLSGRYVDFALASNTVDGDFRLGRPTAFIIDKDQR
jgi:hypothetical protein